MEKAIMNNIFSKEEYTFIADIINSTRDTNAPIVAIEAYAKHSDTNGPIGENHSLHEHIKLSISIFDKLNSVTLTKYDIVDKD